MHGKIDFILHSDEGELIVAQKDGKAMVLDVHNFKVLESSKVLSTILTKKMKFEANGTIGSEKIISILRPNSNKTIVLYRNSLKNNLHLV